jgi:3-hydroxyacyl-CoA dehydrogenase
VKEDLKISRNISVGLTFNPARYLKLFEIIPGPATSQEVLDFFTTYGEKF